MVTTREVSPTLPYSPNSPAVRRKLVIQPPVQPARPAHPHAPPPRPPVCFYFIHSDGYQILPDVESTMLLEVSLPAVPLGNGEQG